MLLIWFDVLPSPQLIQEFSKFVSGVKDCVVYNTPEYANRGFCFLDFDSHKVSESSNPPPYIIDLSDCQRR